MFMKYNRVSLSHKLKIISGQVSGLIKMIEEDKYCVDLLTQSLAIQNALKSIDKTILENHLKSCVVDQIRNGEEARSTKELLSIYALSRKG